VSVVICRKKRAAVRVTMVLPGSERMAAFPKNKKDFGQGNPRAGLLLVF
jgi:hypothetical protein